MKNHFASVIGKSEVWNSVRSLRKSLGNLTFNRPTIVDFFARCNGCLNPLSLPTSSVVRYVERTSSCRWLDRNGFEILISNTSVCDRRVAPRRRSACLASGGSGPVIGSTFLGTRYLDCVAACHVDACFQKNWAQRREELSKLGQRFRMFRLNYNRGCSQTISARCQFDRTGRPRGPQDDECPPLE